MLRTVSLSVNCNKNRNRFLEEWTYLLSNDFSVYFGESVKYAYGAKIFLYCSNRFTFVERCDCSFFARSGNVLLRMPMFLAFMGQIAPLPLSGLKLHEA